MEDMEETKRSNPFQNTRLSGMYFVTFFSFAAILPFAALYYSNAGFSGAQIGALLGVGR